MIRNLACEPARLNVSGCFACVQAAEDGEKRLHRGAAAMAAGEDEEIGQRLGLGQRAIDDSGPASAVLQRGTRATPLAGRDQGDDRGDLASGRSLVSASPAFR